ncbi:hypothetical protein BH23ACT11_BH23ACT11_02860 [soil metagenome]
MDTLGSVGFVIAFLGTVLAVGVSWENAFAIPELARQAPDTWEAGPPAHVMAGLIFSFALFSIGWLLLAIDAFRTHSYPRSACVVLAIGAVLAFIPVQFSTIIFSIGVAWLGFIVAAASSSSAGHSPRVQ